MAEALVPNRVQFQAFIVAEGSLSPKQRELSLFMLLRLPLSSALAPQAVPFLAGEWLDQTVATPAEQLLVPMKPGPQGCQPSEVERGQHQLAKLAEAQSSQSPRLIRFQQLPGLHNGPC